MWRQKKCFCQEGSGALIDDRLGLSDARKMSDLILARKIFPLLSKGWKLCFSFQSHKHGLVCELDDELCAHRKLLENTAGKVFGCVKTHRNHVHKVIIGEGLQHLVHRCLDELQGET